MRVVIAIAVALAAAPATARASDETMTPSRTIGWSLGLGWIAGRTQRDEIFGLDLRLHLGRRIGPALVRGEASAHAGAPGEHAWQLGLVLVEPLIDHLRCGFKCQTFGIDAEVGAAGLWLTDRDGGRARAALIVGLSAATSIAQQAAPPFPSWLRTSLGARVLVFDGGWAITGGLELSWQR